MRGPPPLATLFDRARGARLPLSPSLERWYGPLRFPRPRLRPYFIANFVSTLDGVVALEGIRGGGREISGGNPEDRLLMGVLRAAADAVVVGAGTLRSVPRHLWTAEHVFPALRTEFAALRKRLGLSPFPTNVVVTASGNLDLTLPVFRTRGLPCLVVTTPRGARSLREADVPSQTEIRSTGETERVSAKAITRVLRERLPRARLVLLEGGPHLLAGFLTEGALDELFLTVAPQLAGRVADRARLALVEGRTFGPERPLWSSLVSVRRAGDYLLLRYRVPSPGPSF
ncbi:MAG: dihydrofolate reductase family protein [Thermoplasmata archaeon]|nr:dihydrofolate reductase family protein [Thermoplasmata archaeon]MCI4359507.1 dihydrofolate reductase family protein [Thermoplasmata archaeon]